MKSNIFKVVIIGIVAVVLAIVFITSIGDNSTSESVEKDAPKATELTFSGSFSQDGEFIKTVVSQMGYYGELSEHSTDDEKIPKEIKTKGIESWWELNDGGVVKYITFKDYQVTFEN